jgi:predicted MPP superfamily phosphohydrolase
MSTPADSNSATGANATPGDASRISRRRLFQRFAAYATVAAVGTTYATQIEPFWPVFHELTIALPALPASFHGFRVAQLTDLHAGRTPFGYLENVVSRVMDLQPDLVVVTGDLVHHDPNWVEAVSKLLGTFRVPVLVSYGNHDYGIDREEGQPACLALPDIMEDALVRNGCRVLRNASMNIEHSDGRLWFVGLDDLWFGGFDPNKSFAGVPRDEAVIALTHNPDTAEIVDLKRPGLMLSGHTHGGQVRLPLVGALYLNTYNRRLDQGLFHLRHSTLYVSRGVGYIHRIRFYCRPEIPIFRLVQA